MALTLAQARTLLRRRLQEPTTDQWTNAELDTLLNLGLSDVQALVQGSDPDANITYTDQNIVADQADYNLPTGTWYPVSVGMLNDTGDMADLDDPITLGETHGIADGVVRWTLYGRKVRLSPVPTEAVTNGLRIYHIASLAATVDGDALPIIDPLHGLVVLYAEHWAYGETGESAEAVQDKIDRMEARLAGWFRRTGAPDRVNPDVSKGYDNE